MKKRLIGTVAAVGAIAVVGAAVAASAAYSVVEARSVGRVKAATVQVAKAVHVDVSGGYPLNGTVIFERIYGVSTAHIATVTCVGGKGGMAVGDSNVWFVAGDSLQRRGTATGGVARVILDGE